MRLATRTGLAAMAAATIAVLLVSAVAVFQFQRSLYLRVDDDLRQRAETAPVLAAIGSRVAASELSPTIAGARVRTANGDSLIGRLPDSGLPSGESAGFWTATIDGEDWRVLTVEVTDVPRIGDAASVDLVQPLGDVDDQARQLRRRAIFVGLLVAIAAGLIGLLLGRRATAPLAALRRDAAAIGRASTGDATPAPRPLQTSYGAPDVDDVAGAIDDGLGRLADETDRREAALGAARSFAAAASHELRTPLQAAMAQLDLALTDGDGGPHGDAVASARGQLDRMAAALTAVRGLTEVDLVEPRWFVAADLSDLADQAVAALSAAELGDATIEFAGDEIAPVTVWPEGAALAIENIIRNALRHGRPPSGAAPKITVTIDAAKTAVIVDDDGPGIPVGERARVTQPFERGTTAAPGSGLGLAFVAKVATAHGGSLRIDDAPAGGTRIELAFSSPA